MYQPENKMGGNFTGVKNEKLTRRFGIAGVVLAVIAAATAADLALVQPRDLATQLAAARGTKPAIFMVGPNVLYRSNHIPGSVFAGPGMTPAGLEMLKASVEKLPRDREIIVYCGCCPWDHCPNIKPVLDQLRQMGFTKAKALYLGTGFKADWLDKGFPGGQF